MHPLAAKPTRHVQGNSRLVWLPVIVAFLLSIPCFTWPFLWDDFDFLVRAKVLHLRDLLPDPAAALYRPISREVYFSALQRLGLASPFLAHMMNALLTAGCVLLLGSLIRRLSGSRAGIVGSLVFSSAAAIPFLIGWISGSQDLLCILFALGAYHMFEQGRSALGSASFAAAILSKETALALIPALLVMSIRPGPKRRASLLRTGFGLSIVVAGWAALHPWIRRALARHEVTSVNEYVTFQGSKIISGLAGGLPSLFNMSWSREHEWHPDTIVVALLASVVTIVALRWAPRSLPNDAATSPSSRRRLLAAGALTILGPFVLTSSFISHWSAYYAVISAAGLAMVAAPFLSSARWQISGLTILAFLWLGVASRVAVIPPEVPAEHNMRVTAGALRQVEKEFKAIEPSLPRGARVYLYVQAGGKHGIYLSLYRNQPLRVWYRDPSIEIRDPMHLARSTSDEFLFWISPQLQVFEIDTHSLRPRTSRAPVPLPEYQKTLRAFALGLAGRGEIDRAVSILIGMQSYSDFVTAYDRRSAAAILYAAGRDEEAQQILSTTAHFHRPDALEQIRGLINKPIPGIDLDDGALRAFEVAPTDTSAIRELMRGFGRGGYSESSDRFARRLLALVPNDPEATGVRRRALEAGSQRPR